MSLERFHPLVQRWFRESLGEPTAAQSRGWEAIRDGRHTLIAAPTGSGKTLAAFLSAIDELLVEGLAAPLPDTVRVVYVSPLKALSADIEKNLAAPLRGIDALCQDAGLAPGRITTGVRTGDTTSSARAAMLRKPPHILITTPESLYLLLTAEKSREMLRGVRSVIVDEIHAVIGTRRGAHLALTLERLQHVAGAPLQRIGLSATQKPIEQVAEFLAGDGVRASRPPVAGRPARRREEVIGDDRGHEEVIGRDARSQAGETPALHGRETPAVQVAIIDTGHRRAMDLAVEIPGSPLGAVMASEVWTEYYDRLTRLINEHRTTLVFVNTRKMAERVARHLSERLGEDAVTAHHGSLSKEQRLDAESRLKSGRLRALVATASLELGIDIGHVDLVCQLGSPHRIATFLQRIGRSGHTIGGTPKGRLFALSLDDLVECAALLRAVRQGELDRIVAHDAPLDVLAQQLVAESACEEYGEDELFALVRRAQPYRELARETFDAVVAMVSEGFSTRHGRRGALVHRDEVNGRVRGRRAARLLAITSGGAIPDVADYRVVLEPEETFIGTLNEDFAIESNVGDIFQLGNASWQVLQVGTGIVRVADAKGAPPTIPFWLGEAPARSDELSRAVSELRAEVERQLTNGGLATAIEWLSAETGLHVEAAHEIASYLADSLRILGALPTHDTIILERFFDESGGMQLILHAPLGSRINRAWGLALRKRFCRQFDFELQAAATEDALLLSLGPQHSFPLADVFRYLHPATAREVLVQAFLDAPVWQTRWRWNTTIALAVPRNRGGKKVPAYLQRALSDDLMAAVFPDAAACFENIAGDREIPDHPLVNQAVRDCLEEAMDYDGLARVLTRIHAGDIRMIACDTVEPSPLCAEIVNARPYAFLDDAPLEERRTMAVQSGRSGQLDESAIERVRDEERPDPRDADELHDALLTAGFLLDREAPEELFAQLMRTRRAGRVAGVLIAAERLPELLAIHPVDTGLAAPPSRRKVWTREAAIVELLRGRLTLCGPTTSPALAAELRIAECDADAALLSLEGEGAVLRGAFTREARGTGVVEWCDRRLLARIHRYTLNRLRAEIEPVHAADFQRFLFDWQHVAENARLRGADGLQAILRQLDGFELAASSWERFILPARMERYEPSMLDTLCLSGQIGWGRLSRQTALVGMTPIALFNPEHAAAWRDLADTDAGAIVLSDEARRILDALRLRGASFARELAVSETTALTELVAAGLITSDGFGGLRALVDRRARLDLAGRWSLFAAHESSTREELVEIQARTLLERYGVVFRRLLARETNAAPWRELSRVYRTLEARGEIRGGRFVSGMPGEQFALPAAVERMREVRRERGRGGMIVISAADPLNLTGILTSGERVRTSPSNRIAYREGVAITAMEGDYVRTLAELEAEVALEAAAAVAGRRVPAAQGFVGRMSGQ